MSLQNKRSAKRSKVSGDVYVVDIESGIEFSAEAIDTSRGGLAFHSPMEPAMGAEMEVTLPGSMKAAFKVLRINAFGGGFSVAGSLRERWSQ